MATSTTTPQDTTSRSVPQRLQDLWGSNPLVRHLLTALLAFFVVLFVLASVGDFTAVKLTEMAYIAIAAGGLTLLTGLNGQISLGHGALMAIGAYTTALLLATDNESPLPLVLVVLIAVGVTMVVGLLIGVAAARLHGPYLAGATLTLAVAVPELGKYFDQLGGEQGLRLRVPEIPDWAADIFFFITGVDPSGQQYVAFLAWLTLIVVYFLLANMASSRSGRRWAAVRDDEVAAEIAGIDLRRNRVSAFVVSSAAAGAAGAMFALGQRTVAPGGFSINLSLVLLAIVVLGGLGSLTGAVLLSGIFVFLPQFVLDIGADADIDATRASQMATLAFGLTMVLVILLAPRGLAGGIRTARMKLTKAAGRGPKGPTPPPDDPGTTASPAGTTPDSGAPSTTDAATKENSSTPIITKKGTS